MNNSTLPTTTSSSLSIGANGATDGSKQRSGSMLHKGKTPLVFFLTRLKARLCRPSVIMGLSMIILCIAFTIHRLVALTLTTKTWAPAPIQFISRDCPAVSYPSYSTSTTTTQEKSTGPSICMTTLTDQQKADPLQRFMKWRQFNNLLSMTWPNKQAYCEKHGYKLFDSSAYLDNSRPPSWSKIKAAQRLLAMRRKNEDGDGDVNTHDTAPPMCDWVVWLDADTVIMNSEKPIEAILPTTPNHDFVVTKQKTSSYNAGAWMIRNTEWSRQFLQTWWDMDEYVRVKGLSVSGDNDALFHYLTERMPTEEFQKHIVVPPRCSFNSVTKWVSPQEAKDFAEHPSKVKEEDYYMHEEYYHQGDLIAHVAGRNNKIDTTEELLLHAK